MCIRDRYKVASNVKPYQAADHIGKVLGDTAFVLPYSQELEEQYLAGNLLANLTLKDIQMCIRDRAGECHCGE